MQDARVYEVSSSTRRILVQFLVAFFMALPDFGHCFVVLIKQKCCYCQLESPKARFTLGSCHAGLGELYIVLKRGLYYVGYIS